MKKYILKRFLQLIPVLIGITFLSFAMMRIAGSDAITELYGDKGAVAQEIIDAKRAELGLDQPLNADNALAVHIRHIREKIEYNPAEPRYLKVVWGKGYKMEADSR